MYNFFMILAVDFLHEVELGLFKNVFAHLVRMLHSRPELDVKIPELNRR